VSATLQPSNEEVIAWLNAVKYKGYSRFRFVKGTGLFMAPPQGIDGDTWWLCPTKARNAYRKAHIENHLTTWMKSAL
jgi:hypothetical protein